MAQLCQNATQQGSVICTTLTITFLLQLYRLMQNAIPVTKLAELGDSWKNYDVLGIDEGQFFIDVAEFAEQAAQAGKIVIISALGATFQREGFKASEGFGAILDLIPKAEKIKQLHAICRLCYH